MIIELFNKFEYMLIRTINNLDIFCFSILFIIFLGYVVYFIVKILNKLILKSEIKEIKLDILLVPFISIFMICAAALILKSWGSGKDAVITDSNVLSAIVSFISPFIAFTGAYTLSEINHNKSEKLRIENEKKEKLEKQEKIKKEIEHKKNMLFTMLEYTIYQTRIATKEIEEYYQDNYKSLNIGNSIFLHEKYGLTGSFKDDFRKMMFVESANDCGIFMRYCRETIDERFFRIVEINKISERLIYIEDWYNYLDCVPKIEDVQGITFWINLIKYNGIGINTYTYMFIVNRYNIDSIIKKYYPKAINEGIRGTYGMVGIDD